MTMKEACTDFGSDGVRYALADAGDSLEDANFVEDQGKRREEKRRVEERSKKSTQKKRGEKREAEEKRDADSLFLSSRSANAAILRLWTQWHWTVQTLQSLNTFRTGEMHLLDRVFQSQINRAVAETDDHFNRTMFKAGLKSGFFDMQSARDT